MAFDGSAVAALVHEFNDKLLQGRITKIQQTEKDELTITIKTYDGQFLLQISSNASLPLIYLTDIKKPAPLVAPNFCMLLRKHINSGFIEEISQPSLERVIDFKIRHLDDLGDVCYKHLIVELMGKHSNIIFTDDKGMILDSIKHINAVMSSVRQVMPGKEYFIPDSLTKLNPLDATRDDFFKNVFSKPMELAKAIYSTYAGISPIVAEEICYEANIDSSTSASAFVEGNQNLVWMKFYQWMNHIKNGEFNPVMYEKDDLPSDFSANTLECYKDMDEVQYNSMSELIYDFYRKRDVSNRMRQKSADLKKIINTCLERENKKYNIQLKQLKDTEKKDKFKVYGDILTTYGYEIEQGTKEYKTTNFYNGEEITIPLDTSITPIENAKKYFNKYAKMKRTYEALIDITKETKASIDYLESISVALDMSETVDDISAIKSELQQTGFIKKHVNKKKKASEKSKPLHFVSSDGLDMFVGKNNIQNEELTFKVANGSDWWFHAKEIPGSHVIVRANNQELPDATFEEAARLAAHFSKGSNQSKVEIDYVKKKEVKKVPGAMPGFVIYHTNYSMTVSPDISGIKEIED